MLVVCSHGRVCLEVRAARKRWEDGEKVIGTKEKQAAAGNSLLYSYRIWRKGEREILVDQRGLPHVTSGHKRGEGEGIKQCTKIADKRY